MNTLDKRLFGPLAVPQIVIDYIDELEAKIAQLKPPAVPVKEDYAFTPPSNDAEAEEAAKLVKSPQPGQAVAAERAEILRVWNSTLNDPGQEKFLRWLAVRIQPESNAP